MPILSNRTTHAYAHIIIFLPQQRLGVNSSAHRRYSRVLLQYLGRARVEVVVARR